jgi:uncharacterized protein with von Willebrand factor type A (vWA) domain
LFSAENKENRTIQEFVVDLARRLRESGLRIGVSEVIDCAVALSLIDLSNIKHVYLALYSTMVKDSRKYEILKHLIEERNKETNDFKVEIRIEGAIRDANALTSYSHDDMASSPVLAARVASAKRYKLSFKMLLRRFGEEQGRRKSIVRAGRIDFRRTMRKSISKGWIYRIVKTERRKARGRVVVLFDVSGSMQDSSTRILPALWACCTINRCNAFIFSTSLMHVSDLVRGRPITSAIQTLREAAKHLGRGTRIGSSLNLLSAEYEILLKGCSLLVIVSDGCDLEEAELVGKAMSRIRKLVGSIIWFNPLAELEGYKPETKAMLASLPYVDMLLPLALLENPPVLRKKIVTC